MALSATLAASAQAAVVHTYDVNPLYGPAWSEIIVTDTAGEANTLSVELRDSNVLIRDSSAALTEDSERCEQLSTQTVSCGLGRYPPGLFVIAGDGNDSVLLDGGLPAEIRGGAGDDVLYGGAESDRLSGGLGRDRVHGGPGDELVEGPTTYEPAAPEPDVLEGGEGSDAVSYAGRDNRVYVDLSSGAGGERGEGDTLANIEGVAGGNGRDVLTGTDGPNLIEYRTGDTVAAKGGDDLITVRTAATRAPRVTCGTGYDDVSFGVERYPGPPLDLARGCERISARDVEDDHEVGWIDLRVRRLRRSTLWFATEGFRPARVDLYLPGRGGRAAALLGTWPAAYARRVAPAKVAVRLTALGRRKVRPGTKVRVVMHVSWSEYDSLSRRHPWATAWITVPSRR